MALVKMPTMAAMARPDRWMGPMAMSSLAIASVFGAPANTTYGENTGVLNLTKVFDPKVIRIAAGLAIVLAYLI